ncbi:MAG TPA: response regulator [Thermoanaerobaculia bacterium]|jgi:CheY-like chemotaxis protein
MSHKPVILVVDDDGPILLLMRNLLREFGFEPVTASTGPQAVEQASTRIPDLVLLDKNMPGMSGAEVVRVFRTELGLDTLPILILSGEPVAPDELRTLGANAAVLKPFDVPALIEQIRTHLSVAK